MPFFKFHLANKDVILILEDDSGERAELNHIAEKTGLSAGWRKFAAFKGDLSYTFDSIRGGETLKTFQLTSFSISAVIM